MLASEARRIKQAQLPEEQAQNPDVLTGSVTQALAQDRATLQFLVDAAIGTPEVERILATLQGLVDRNRLQIAFHLVLVPRHDSPLVAFLEGCGTTKRVGLGAKHIGEFESGHPGQGATAACQRVGVYAGVADGVKAGDQGPSIDEVPAPSVGQVAVQVDLADRHRHGLLHPRTRRVDQPGSHVEFAFSGNAPQRRIFRVGGKRNGESTVVAAEHASFHIAEIDPGHTSGQRLPAIELWVVRPIAQAVEARCVEDAAGVIFTRRRFRPRRRQPPVRATVAAARVDHDSGIDVDDAVRHLYRHTCDPLTVSVHRRP